MFVCEMCVFVSRPMKIVTFLLKSADHPKRVVDFPRERRHSPKQNHGNRRGFLTKKITTTTVNPGNSRGFCVCESKFLHCSFFFSSFSFIFSFFLLFHFLHFSIFSFFSCFHFFHFSFHFLCHFLSFSIIFFHFLSFSFIIYHFLSFSFTFFFHFLSWAQNLIFLGPQFRYDFY